jgi:hypothetical protein
LRGIASQVLVAARDDGNSNDVSILAWGVDGTDIVKVGDTFAACLKLSVASGADVRMLDNNVTVWAASKANGFVFADGSNASITYGVAATGANGKSTEFSAQDGDATFNGGSITIKSGAPGAGGSSAGAVVLDSRLAGTASGLINFSANGSAFLRHSYNTGTTRTLVQTGGSNLRFDTTTLELDVTNIALLNATGSFGGGLGVVDWTDATVEPTGDTSTSVRLWAFGTTLKAHNQALTTIAPTVESAPGAEDIRVPDRRAKRVRTTNNTPTTAYSFALPTSCSAFFDVTITAYTPADGTSAGYRLTGEGKRFGGGGATIVGTATTESFEDNASMNAVLDASGNNIIVVITGLAATTIEWLVVPKVTLMQPA